jgi:hypothetical protein
MLGLNLSDLEDELSFESAVEKSAALRNATETITRQVVDDLQR